MKKLFKAIENAFNATIKSIILKCDDYSRRRERYFLGYQLITNLRYQNNYSIVFLDKLCSDLKHDLSPGMASGMEDALTHICKKLINEKKS